MTYAWSVIGFGTPGGWSESTGAVVRAAEKLIGADPDWRTFSSHGRGNMLVFFYAASVPSTAMGRVMTLGSWEGNRRSLMARVAEELRPENRREAKRRVWDHVMMRDGTEEERRRLTERLEAEQQFHMAKLGLAATVARNPMGV